MGKKTRREMRIRRHRRVRKNLAGTPEQPRLNVFRSLNQISAQVVDDQQGHTLASCSTLEGEIKSEIKGLDKTAQAKVVGRTVAERAIKAGVKKVVFDRGGYQYHGRVKVLAEAAREAGLEF